MKTRMTIAAVALGLSACASDPAATSAERKSEPAPAAVAASPVQPPDTPPITSTAGVDIGPLHNVLLVAPGVYSGSGPDSAGAFDELQKLGVRTVISVDGAVPEVALAEARGMRYVHVPVGYNGVHDEDGRRIAKALRSLDGPVYLHCHHGLHRGPAAAAMAMVLLGEIEPDAAVAFLRVAKTSPNYPGLYRCVGEAAPMSPDELASFDREDIDLPSVARVGGLVDTMVKVDQAFTNLKHIRAAGWRTPADHPDLVPAAEAGRLADLLRDLTDDPEVAAKDDEFRVMLAANAADASALEELFVDGRADADRLELAWKRLDTTCKDCHTETRDVPW